jgi:hypothetical protein
MPRVRSWAFPYLRACRQTAARTPSPSSLARPGSVRCRASRERRFLQRDGHLHVRIAAPEASAVPTRRPSGAAASSRKRPSRTKRYSKGGEVDLVVSCGRRR